jgi:hypothetical protein
MLFLEFYSVIAADKNVTEFPRLRHALILGIAYFAIVTLGAQSRDVARTIARCGAHNRAMRRV